MKAENSGLNKNTDEISLKDLVSKIREWNRYIISKWVIILGFGLLGGLVGFTYASFQKPVYTATTTFVLEEADKGGGLGQYAGLASMMGVDIGGSGGGIFVGDNILELYRSRRMIQKALLSEVEFGGKKERLIDRYIEFNNLRQAWDDKPNLKGIQFGPDLHFKREQDSIIGKMVKNINENYLSVTKPDKKLNIIKTEVKAPDELFSKFFNEQIVKNVNDFYVQTKTKKSLTNVAILQQKTDSVRAVMDGAIYRGVAVSDATPNLNPTRQVQRTAPMQRSQFTAETNKAILTELVKNLELSKIALRKETPLIQVIDEPVLPLEVNKLGKLKAIVVGGFLFGFLSLFFVLIKKLIKSVNTQ